MWPDQNERFDRLRAALDIAGRRGSSMSGGATRSTTPPAVAASLDRPPVITNTWVLNYLTADARRAYVAALDELGRERDLSWIFLETPLLVPELPVERSGPVRVGPRARAVAGRRATRRSPRCRHPHGYWMHWAGSPT